MFLGLASEKCCLRRMSHRRLEVRSDGMDWIYGAMIRAPSALINNFAIFGYISVSSFNPLGPGQQISIDSCSLRQITECFQLNHNLTTVAAQLLSARPDPPLLISLSAAAAAKDQELAVRFISVTLPSSDPNPDHNYNDI